jgi:hypothetical protein
MVDPKVPAAVIAKAKELLASELELDELEPRFKKAEAKNKSLREEMNGMLSDLGVSSITLDGIGRIHPTFMGPYASIEKNEDGSTSEAALAALAAWTKKKRLYSVIFRTTPNVQRISGIVKQALEGQGEIPPGVKFYLLKGVSFTRDQKLPAKQR